MALADERRSAPATVGGRDHGEETTYVATAPDGSTHTRTSARTYTHAVLVFGAELVRQGAPERAMSLTKNASIVTEPASGFE